MKKKLSVLICALPLVLAGCMKSSLADWTSQLKDDPAIVTGHITTLYGQGYFVRIGGVHTNQGVSVAPDGTVSIK